ncbi:hypothetical protein [Pseudonocardia sp.]|uniref:hypothetical protein n=1 Tax=Pseudonocardia sp. TaxID=60912 RepID=UPI00260C5AD4|nr:hypothetical protein [Pseudonocardia sp.]
MTTRSGYTALACVAPGCGLADPATVGPALVEALRRAVRASGHGVLVSAGCPFAGACGPRAVAPVVVVQPCDDERRPTSCALTVGPLRTEADVEAFTAWLRAGDLDPRLLPAHLLDAARRAAARGR